MLDHYKANPIPRDFNVAGVLGFKTTDKPLTRTHWIESPDTFQTFTHRFNPNGNQILQVALLDRD